MAPLDLAIDFRKIGILECRMLESHHEPLTRKSHADLRAMARRLLGSRSAHTLQATELVHEAFLRLREVCEDDPRPIHELRPLFATVMRRTLIDHARRSRARHEAVRIGAERQPERSAYVIALDEALRELALHRPRLARLVELRFFGSFSIEETAEQLDISVRTAVRDWQIAKAWLQRAIEGGDDVE